jgi:hypothetical protein
MVRTWNSSRRASTFASGLAYWQMMRAVQGWEKKTLEAQETSVVAARGARSFWPSEHVIVCGLLSGLIGAALSKAAGRYGDLRNGSKSAKRALRSQLISGFPGPDLFDHFAHSGHRLLTPPYRRWLFAVSIRSRRHSHHRISILFLFRQHRPDFPGHLVRQGDRHQHPRFPRQHPSQP